MPLYDVDYTLASGVTITASANGADVSCAAGGQLAGIKNGLIIMGVLRFTGAIDETTGDEELTVTIQEKIGSNYRTIGTFRTIGTAQDPGTGFASSGDYTRCFFTVDPSATNLRYVATVAGTTPSFAGMQIILVPTLQGPPW